jgi:hypothetical protein
MGENFGKIRLEGLQQAFRQIDIRIYPSIVVRALRGGLSDDFKHK